MSPKSRSRKPARAVRRTANRGRPAASREQRSRDPDFRAMYDAFMKPLGMLADPTKVARAFDAEALVSVPLGVLSVAALGSPLLGSTLGALVDELARDGSLPAYLALRTLAVIGPPDIAERAMRASDGKAVADVPDWAGQLGKVTPGPCVALADSYGQTQTLLCEFSYADSTRRHGVWAVIDATWHGGLAALALVDPPDQTRQDLLKRARRDGAAVREVTAAEAAALLQGGIDAFVRYGCAPGDAREKDAYTDLCASLGIARHRAATLAAPGVPGDAGVSDDVAARWPELARQRLAEEFLASPYGRDLRGAVARKLPLLMTGTCVNQLGCDPQLIGPLLLERVLLHVLPRVLIAPDRHGAEIPPFMRAWTDWAAERNGIPPRQRRHLMRQLEFMLRRFRALWDRGDTNPLRRYVQDVPDEIASNGDMMFPVIERRTFAVPEPAERGNVAAVRRSGKPGELHADELDAADETDRRLITMLGLGLRGIPEDRFDSYATVTEQIWLDDPPDAWAAVSRLLATGHSRDAILDRLSRTWDKAGRDGERYIAGLVRLGVPRNH